MKETSSVQNEETLPPGPPSDVAGSGQALQWRPWGFLGMWGLALACHGLFCFYMLPSLESVFIETGGELPFSIRIYLSLFRTIIQNYIPTGFLILLALVGGPLGIHWLLRRRPALQRIYSNVIVAGLFFMLLIVFVATVECMRQSAG